MAAYHRIYGFGHLQADRQGLGAAPEPHALFDHWTIVTFTVD